MNRDGISTGVICFLALLTSASVSTHGATDNAARTTAAADIKTGEVDLTFNLRSPLSTRKELARRLSLKESDMGEDYDLAKRPFKAYIPKTYEASTPCGVFVYLGYKDSVSVAPLWEPALDKAHVIFITPVAHHGEHYPNQIPLWQQLALAFDAVHNLKQQYAINEKRLYYMSFNDGSMQTAIVGADEFTGLVVAMDSALWVRMVKRDKAYYPPRFSAPPEEFIQKARRRAFILIEQNVSEVDGAAQLTVATMKRLGFAHVLPVALSLGDDIHYPMFKVEWFEQTALPFLDGVASAGAKAPKSAEAANDTAATRTSGPTSAAPGDDKPNVASADAQHRLALGQLYFKNRQFKLARTKLEEIVHYYPTDPAAAKAKQLLDQLPAE